MTIFFPDVSEYTSNIDVSQYPVILARATLSDRVADTSYTTYRQRAAGKVFMAYHWLNHGNLRSQANWCFQHVGPNTPVMIDAEDQPGNTGYNGPLTLGDITGFAAEYRALGGTVSMVYLPFWYWSGAMGAPYQLDQLTAAGLHLVSSNYPNAGYTENGPGWAPYYQGAPPPVQWQYTSTPIDMNAFRGSVDDYRKLIGGDMPTVFQFSIGADGPVPNGIYYGTIGGGFWWESSPDMQARFLQFAAAHGVAIDTSLGTISTIDATCYFGPYVPWNLDKIGNTPGPAGPPGPPGPKGDAAVLAPGAVLHVETLPAP
jgi:hypothetical protein